MKNSLPLCFYPMKKIILDDDNAFSQSMLLKMFGENFISYSSPKDALNYLLKEYQPLLVKSDFLDKNTLSGDFFNQHIINIGSLWIPGSYATSS